MTVYNKIVTHFTDFLLYLLLRIKYHTQKGRSRLSERQTINWKEFKMGYKKETNLFSDKWQLLCRIGAVAAFISTILIPVAIASHILWPPPPWKPGAAADWFVYLQDNPVAGLLNLDFLLEIGLVISIPLYLSLYVVLKKITPSFMLIAVSLTLLGVLLHVLSNSALEMLWLSNAHADALTDDHKRSILLAAGEARLSVYYGMVFQLSYVLGYISYILIGLVMRRSPFFGKKAGNLAILTGIAGFGFYLPQVGMLLSVLVVTLIGIWNVTVGLKLLKLTAIPIPTFSAIV